MDMQRLEWHLGNWADYMKAPTHRLGYPSQSMCIASGGESCVDAFEVMCEEVDMQSAQSIDAMIDSLKAPQRTAINHVWLKVKHHYPTQDMDYEDGINALLVLVEKRGLI